MERPEEGEVVTGITVKRQRELLSGGIPGCSSRFKVETWKKDTLPESVSGHEPPRGWHHTG